MRTLLMLIIICACLLLLPANAFALSVSASQAGADSDEIMKDSTFIVEASGWSGSCSTATINFDGCSSCSISGENSVKSIGGGASSVSWTTTMASMKATTQYVTVTVSSGCTVQSADTSNFDIVLPPSLSLTVTPSVSSVAAGGSFSVNLDLANNGETTASDISISASGIGISGSCSSISSIDEGSSGGDACILTASTAGTYTVTMNANPGNGGNSQDTFQITATSSGSPGDSAPGGSAGPSGGAGVTSGIKQTINIGELVAGTPGIAQFTLTNLALRLVTITSTSDSVGVSVKAEQEASLPSGAGTSPQGTVYGFLTISALNVDNDDIETATIQFRVNKTWLGNNGIDPADIILQRFHDGVWQELNTSVKSSGTDYVTYSASTPGFSVFAITSKPVPVVAGDDASLCNNNGICEDGEDITNCAADCQIDGDASPPTTGDVISTDTPESLPITVYIVLLVIIIIIILAFVIMKRNKNI